MPDENDREFKTIVEDIKSSTENLVSMSDDIPDEIILTLKHLTNDIMLVNFVCTNLPLPVTDKVKLLKIDSIKERALELLKMESRQMQRFLHS